jgi:hypothetical protein
MEHLQEILNEYAANGFRVISVDRTDYVLYDGNTNKYTLYLEQKAKNE